MGRLDVYEALPEGMREYLSNHGWHFSKKLAEYATHPSDEECRRHVAPLGSRTGETGP